MCVEVSPDQSVISEGEEACEVGGLVGLAGTGGRDVYVDNSQLRPIDLDHDGLVLEVRVVWEQGGQVVLPV